jgi:PPP family 3-phenylpropionic acid transporter
MPHDSASAAASPDGRRVGKEQLGQRFRDDAMRAEETSGLAARLAIFYAALFVQLGIQMPFFPVWLKAKDVDAGMIGIVLAAPIVARLLAVPVVMREADRRDAVRHALIACGFVAAAGYAFVGLSAGAVLILVAYALTSLATTPQMPLAETYALKELAVRRRTYGPVRLWGSFAFIAGNFVAGFAADIIQARDLIWLIAAASILIALAALALPPMTPRVVEPQAPASTRQNLLRDRPFVAVVAAASLIQASHALYYGFSAVQWSAAGFDGAVIATLWALGVAAEIVLFALQSRLPPLFEPTVLLLAGACGGVLRWIGMAFDPPAFMLAALQLLHALSFGATHLGALMFLARHAPPAQAATAQGYLAMASGLAMAGAMALSGVLYRDFGSAAYAAMALTTIAGGACGLIARRLGGEAPR